MKCLFLTLLLVAVALPAYANPRKPPTFLPPVPISPYGEHYVQGHLRRDGTYIPGHFRANTRRSVYGNPLPTITPPYSPVYPYAGRRAQTVRPYYDTVPVPVMEPRLPSSHQRSRRPPPVSPPVYLPPTNPVVDPPIYPAPSTLVLDPTLYPVSSNDELAPRLPALIGSNATQVSNSLAGSGYWLYKTHTQEHGDSAEFRHGDDGVEIYYVNGKASRWEMRSYR